MDISRFQGRISGMEHTPRLLDQVRHAIRLRHYSYSTERTYVDWVRRFILANGKRHPRELGAAEVEAFLTDLAVRDNVSASTQNQALSALLFLYRHVLKMKLEWMDNVVRARRERKIPVVFTQKEARTVIAHLQGKVLADGQPDVRRRTARHGMPEASSKRH